MPELLLELFSEEIPAGMQLRATQDLRLLVTRELEGAGLGIEETLAFATPRRLTLILRGVPARQPDRTVERRGPRADAPERARQGFLHGLGGVDHRLEERTDKKGRFIFAVVEERGQATRDIVAGFLPDLLARFPWPRSMRWGDGEARWVRPLRSILCLFDGEAVPVQRSPASRAVTRHPGSPLPGARTPFPVRDVADYSGEAQKRPRLIVDAAERRRLIEDEAARLAEHGEGLAVRR